MAINQTLFKRTLNMINTCITQSVGLFHNLENVKTEHSCHYYITQCILHQTTSPFNSTAVDLSEYILYIHNTDCRHITVFKCHVRYSHISG